MSSIKITDEQLGQFEAQMEAENWTKLVDLFENVYGWIHNGSGKHVNNTDAQNYWLMSGETPIPF